MIADTLDRSPLGATTVRLVSSGLDVTRLGETYRLHFSFYLGGVSSSKVVGGEVVHCEIAKRPIRWLLGTDCQKRLAPEHRTLHE